METVKPTLKDMFSRCQEYLALETHDYKLLEGEKLQTVLNLYGLEGFSSDIYYTNFLLIFTSSSDYENLRFYIKKSKTIFKLEMPEYDASLIALEFFNDSSLPQILNQ
jgi:hypothetical protein